MIEIDGGKKSGSGTILRLSVVFSSIIGEPLRLYNIRKKRSPPGLRPQHLEALLTAAKLCDAEVEGAQIGSTEIFYRPKEIAGGYVESEIGTAGSIPMLIMGVLPITVYAKRATTIKVSKGGTDVRNAPTINYLRYVLLPTLEGLGVKAAIKVLSYGYYPIGMGEVILESTPLKKLVGISLDEQETIDMVKGISVSTHLRERRVAERQAEAARKILEAEGLNAEIEAIYDTSNPLQKGSSIALWSIKGKTAIGADAIGELGKPSEKVGSEAARAFIVEASSGAAVDVHLADMLIPYMALAEGPSSLLTRSITEHLDTNMWLAEEILGVRFNVKRIGDLYLVVRE